MSVYTQINEPAIPNELDEPHFPYPVDLAEVGDVLREYPTLGIFGFPNSLSWRRVPKAEFAEIRKRERAEIETPEVAVRICFIAKWLNNNIPFQKTINRRSTSYYFKHIVERQLGYITNGEFIAAALKVGYPMKMVEHMNPNAYFAMSEKRWLMYRDWNDLNTVPQPPLLERTRGMKPMN